jgi:hypothetical protein
MPTIQSILLFIALILLLSGIGVISWLTGHNEDLPTLQKYIGVIVPVSLIPIVFLAGSYYIYIQENTAAFMPSQIVISFVNLFLVILAFTAAVLSKKL